jgi:hypothetical protein
MPLKSQAPSRRHISLLTELKFLFDFRFYKYVAPLALEQTGAGGK